MGLTRDWWDAESRNGTGPLHYMNATRVRFIRKCLTEIHGTGSASPFEHLQGLSILDVGCGGGLAAEALARLGANVTAIDPGKENIEVARKHSSEDPMTSGIRYLNTTVEEISASDERFDAVCALEVIGNIAMFDIFASVVVIIISHLRLFLRYITFLMNNNSFHSPYLVIV